MRGYFFVIFITLLWFTTSLFSQSRVEITPFYGYQFSGSVPTYDGTADVKDSDEGGVAINFALPMREGTELELLFLRASTRVELIEYSYGAIINQETFDLTYEYYQIGGLNVFQVPGGKVAPFGSFTLGAARFAPQSTNREDEWFFSGTIGAGLKIYASQRIGLRLQGRLLMPFMGGGAGLWCGTGGCSVGVGTSTIFISGDLTAGLIIRL